jgi:phage-related protein
MRGRTPADAPHSQQKTSLLLRSKYPVEVIEIVAGRYYGDSAGAMRQPRPARRFDENGFFIPDLIYFGMAQTSDPTPREKPLHWIGSSKKDYLDFPEQVQSDMGYALGVAQFGRKHPHAKPWKGEGSGVLEVVEDFRGDAFRAVYTVRFTGAVYVLHSFQKKSKTGIKTPREDVALVHDRLKAARDHYETHYQQPRG